MKSIQEETLLVIPYIAQGQGNELFLSVSGWMRFYSGPLHIVVIGDDNERVRNTFPKVEFIIRERAKEVKGQYHPNIDVANKLDYIYELFHDKYDHFVLANDDEYPIREFDCTFLTKTFWLQDRFVGNISKPSNFWIHDMAKTRIALDKEKMPHKNYCNHHPYYFEMEKFHDMSVKFDLKNNSMIRNNLYYNIYPHEDNGCVNEVRFGVWSALEFNKFDNAIKNENIKFVCNSTNGWSQKLEDKIYKIIYGDVKKEEVQKPILGDGGISICLTAWNTQNYIEECLDSIEKQTWFKTHNNWEVILGIDACEKTLDKVKTIMCKYRNMRVLMMDSNKGTYVTSNTIMKEAQYKWIIRFDTDDIMLPNMIETLMKEKKDAEVIRWKMQNFGKESNVRPTIGQQMFSKNVFDKFNGYKDWICGADADFINRVEKNVKSTMINKILMKRRVHNESLTMAKATSYNSEFRKKYIDFVCNKNNYDILDKCINKELSINTFKEIKKDKIIVSFTTWKKRHDSAAKMLEHFKKQTIKPDKIICWLSSDEYEGENIPKCLQKFVDENYIEIQWVKENTYCHKRYEVFKEYNDCYVVLLDDDILYPNDYIKQIISFAHLHKNCVIDYYSTIEEIENCNHRLKSFTTQSSIKNYYLSGFSCFPPNTFPVESFNYEKNRDEITPKCDDSWIKAWLINKDTNIIGINEWKGSMSKSMIIPNSQTHAIWIENCKVHDGIKKRVSNLAKCILFLDIKEKVSSIYPNFNIEKSATYK